MGLTRQTESTIVRIDESGGTVSIDYSGYTLDGDPYEGPRSMGPVRANFSEDSITFNDDGFRPASDGAVVLNRLTGTMLWVTPGWTWKCRSAAPQF